MEETRYKTVMTQLQEHIDQKELEGKMEEAKKLSDYKNLIIDLIFEGLPDQKEVVTSLAERLRKMEELREAFVKANKDTIALWLHWNWNKVLKDHVKGLVNGARDYIGYSLGTADVDIWFNLRRTYQKLYK